MLTFQAIPIRAVTCGSARFSESTFKRGKQPNLEVELYLIQYNADKVCPLNLFFLINCSDPTCGGLFRPHFWGKELYTHPARGVTVIQRKIM